MVTFQVWFDRLPPGRQKALLDDKLKLASAAWKGALQQAQESLAADADKAHARRDCAERDRLQGAAGALRRLSEESGSTGG